MRRGQIHLIRGERSNGALVTYGRGLGGIAVVEYPASPRSHGRAPMGHVSGPAGELSLPRVSLGAVSADELQTSLGTVIHFQRHGVQYVVAGSVPRGVAEEAARGL
jgi:hypothetical protein